MLRTGFWLLPLLLSSVALGAATGTAPAGPRVARCAIEPESSWVTSSRLSVKARQASKRTNCPSHPLPSNKGCSCQSQTQCGLKCVTLKTDHDNCGSCGNKCSSGICEEGECKSHGRNIQLRVEGPDSTIFEGPISATDSNVEFSSSHGAQRCNGLNMNSPGPEGGNALTALVAASKAAGFDVDGQSDGFGDFQISRIADKSTTDEEKWAVLNGFEYSVYGGCGTVSGSVLWAYDAFHKDAYLDIAEVSANAQVVPGGELVARIVDGQDRTHTIEDKEISITIDSEASPSTRAVGSGYYVFSIPPTLQVGDHTIKASCSSCVRSPAVKIHVVEK